jgi:hypothetical protein
MIYRNKGNELVWEDTIWLFQALESPCDALQKYNDNILAENSLKTFVYYWISNLSVLGKVNTNVYSNISSFNSFTDDKGTVYYMCYNPYAKNKIFNFYSRDKNEYLGKLNVLTRELKITSELE